MKKLFFIFILTSLFSCNEYIDKPKNLIGKTEMAEIIADLAINDQVIFLYPKSNLESGTRFILKNHKVKNEDFIASYRYYIIKQKMKGIVDDAQKIIIEKDPKSEKKIKGDIKLDNLELPKAKLERQ
ncbi:DUF4296 domain-containing protein [Chryseobacterium sp.]|uniref:DUF4296 domain-containing protein n=1 Tax=Chryseobacterium sp. TaxID=1871047 RepID=UPI002FC88329